MNIVGISSAFALLAALLAVLSYQADKVTNHPEEFEKEVIKPVPKLGHIVVDTETGCQYILYSSITPRLNKDGHQICN